MLPSTFSGSPRQLEQLCQDALACYRLFGKPDLFITFTSNPNWIEITENLNQGETAWDRPELCNKVFTIKKKHLLDMIFNKNIFGQVVCRVYVIEFQKRGLPHMHFLITFDRNFKITNVSQLNKIIRAEIPDPNTEPRLYEVVSKYQVHRPCLNNPQMPCQRNGR